MVFMALFIGLMGNASLPKEKDSESRAEISARLIVAKLILCCVPAERTDWREFLLVRGVLLGRG